MPETLAKRRVRIDPVRLEGFVTDITERVQREAQLNAAGYYGDVPEGRGLMDQLVKP